MSSTSMVLIFDELAPSVRTILQREENKGVELAVHRGNGLRGGGKKEASTTPPLHNPQEWGTLRKNRRQNPKGCPTCLLLVLKVQLNVGHPRRTPSLA